MSVLHVYRDEPLDGPTNMARDEHLLYAEAARPAALRIYFWREPTISLGCFQRYAAIAELSAEVRELPVVRRLTGGGAILHDREVTYCLTADESIPAARKSPVELYRIVHSCWRDAIASAGGPASELAPEHFPLPSPRTGPFFCFEKPGRTDLLIGGEKVLGSAQRRISGHLLQHGSLLLGRRFAAHPGTHLDEPPAERVKQWVDGFVVRLGASLSLRPKETAWSQAQLADAAVRREKYAGDEWTQIR